MEDAVINRFVFTLLSTSWVWVVYGIEQRWSFVFGNVLLTSFALISVPFFANYRVDCFSKVFFS